MLVLELNGAACAGKSTIAEYMAERGYRVIEIEARECWLESSIGSRQQCFMQRFRSLIEHVLTEHNNRRSVLSNGLLTVVGYTHYILGYDAATEAYTVWAETVRRGLVPVVVVADPHELEVRCLARARARDKYYHIWEACSSPIVQSYIMLWANHAVSEGIPVFYVRSGDPARAAEQLDKMTRFVG